MSETTELSPKKESKLTIGDIFREIELKSKKLRAPEAEGRNFSIQQKRENGQTKLYMVGENGQQKDLSTYLADGFGFKSSDAFVADYGTKEVLYDLGSLKSRGFLLGLFHEIGHSWQESRKDPLNIAVSIKIMKKTKRAMESLENSPDEVKKQKAMDNISDILDPERVFKDIEEATGEHARAERDAWAFALRKLRELEVQGFKVFAGYDSVTDIRKTILASLATHEMAALASYEAVGINSHKHYPFLYTKSKKKESSKT